MASQRSVWLAAAVFGMVVGGLGVTQAQSTKSAHDPSSWVDRRMPEDERTALDAVVGFAPPALGDDTRWIGDGAPASLDEWRGKVVVLQSWTHASEQGRGAAQRVAAVLRNHLGDDVKLILLHTPEDADKADAYLERRKPAAPVLVDVTGRVCDDLAIYKRPTTILIGRDGSIRAAGVAMTSLVKAVETLQAETFDSAAPKAKVITPRDERDPITGRAAAPRPAARPPFPEFSGALRATDLRGRKGPEIRVGQWMGEKPDTAGKVVMVEFWATWCGPCVASIPKLNALQKKFDGRMVLIGVSDESPGTVRSFMRTRKMEYAVASDEGRNMIGVVKPQGIPHGLIMSPDGIVRWQGHPGTLTEEMIQQIIDASGVTAGGNTDAGGPKRWRTTPTSAPAPGPEKTDGKN
jgi:thiol-disulfide isomerase/thioredoxin